MCVRPQQKVDVPEKYTMKVLIDYLLIELESEKNEGSHSWSGPSALAQEPGVTGSASAIFLIYPLLLPPEESPNSSDELGYFLLKKLSK